MKKASSPVTTKAVAAIPIKDSFTKASLTVHLAERAGVEPKAAKALMAARGITVQSFDLGCQNVAEVTRLHTAGFAHPVLS